jgi:hypothetical protein
MIKNYTEEELIEYIFKNHYSLLTFQEKVAHKTLIGEMKIENEDSEMKKQMLRKIFCSSETEVLEILNTGAKEYKKKVCNRVMAEHSNTIKLNLCPKCVALARTSTAKQCPKCFYSWHNEK